MTEHQEISMLIDIGRELNAKYGRKIHLTSKDPSAFVFLGLYFATPCMARSVTEKNWWP